ncbi:MAG: hypothetical protein JSU72_04070 [Deltaproteobacteria bacterium]|nr:MAG: hypothetical protein JSU72_04070 [Deltaproteobacteria bacterium]
MIQRKDWLKVLAITLFIVLTGGYYERLSPETRTMVLPVGFFVVAGFGIARLKRLEYETRSAKVLASKVVSQDLSIVDGKGNEFLSVSTSSNRETVTMYDDNHLSRVTLELFQGEPVLKLVGEGGSAVLSFDENGVPSLTFRGEAGEIIWSAP